jgi:hypothetical protein
MILLIRPYRTAGRPGALLLGVLVATGLCGQDQGGSHTHLPPTVQRTVWDGVYTAEQAHRGNVTFDTYCRSCHQAGFHGAAFMNRWREDRLSSLFTFIRTSMPLGSPGSASESEYLDIVAYLLSSNAMPAGKGELTTAATASIQVVGKGGASPVPDGALVRVVGCLDSTQEGGWTLTHASEPVRTRDVDGANDPERKPVEIQSPGTGMFRLPDVDFYSPGSHKGNTVELKGFLDRNSRGDQLLVTSLVSLSATCPNP